VGVRIVVVARDDLGARWHDGGNGLAHLAICFGEIRPLERSSGHRGGRCGLRNGSYRGWSHLFLCLQLLGLLANALGRLLESQFELSLALGVALFRFLSLSGLRLRCLWYGWLSLYPRFYSLSLLA